jgi:hypothetical protein
MSSGVTSVMRSSKTSAGGASLRACRKPPVGGSNVGIGGRRIGTGIIPRAR